MLQYKLGILENTFGRDCEETLTVYEHMCKLYSLDG